MLKIKVLKGPKPGQIFTLKAGDNVVGRAPNCDIVLVSNGVSKAHAKLIVQNDQCVVTDLASSNGTFVNGTKIKDRILRVGDKIAFHDVIVELGAAQGTSAGANPGMNMQGAGFPQQMPSQFPSAPPQQWNQSVAYQQQVQPYGGAQMQVAGQQHAP